MSRLLAHPGRGYDRVVKYVKTRQRGSRGLLRLHRVRLSTPDPWLEKVRNRGQMSALLPYGGGGSTANGSNPQEGYEGAFQLCGTGVCVGAQLIVGARLNPSWRDGVSQKGRPHHVAGLRLRRQELGIVAPQGFEKRDITTF